VRAALLLTSCAIVATGCGAPALTPAASTAAGPSPTIVVAPSAQPSSSTTGEVLPSTPPLDPDVVGLTCGDDIVFHPALLAVPGHAELDPDLAAEALRREIAGSPPEAGLPRSGWVRVAQLPTRVRFVAPGPSETGWVQYGATLRNGASEHALVVSW
jgi:hypothetical protein